MLKALLFDMDGTLCNSDPLHLRAFQEVLAPEGVTIDEEVYQARISGRTNEAIFAHLLPHRSVTDRERLADAKEARFREIAPDLEPLAGALDLIALAEMRGLALALVTNAPPLNASHMLEALGLAERFPVVIRGGDVERGKPDPLPYLTALDRLGVPASEAMAFEDSLSGVRAAKAAGLFTVALLTGQPREALVEAGADHAMADFMDPGLKAILEERLREPRRVRV
jgi:beta-phosphoglucomutase